MYYSDGDIITNFSCRDDWYRYFGFPGYTAREPEKCFEKNRNRFQTRAKKNRLQSLHGEK